MARRGISNSRFWLRTLLVETAHAAAHRFCQRIQLAGVVDLDRRHPSGDAHGDSSVRD
jgi:hypothetical protein